jgi:IrrE N-terminal-like domain
LGRSLLERILFATGGKLRCVDETRMHETGLSIRSDRDYDITLSCFTMVQVDNFEIAHALGHYFLHYILDRERRGKPTRFPRLECGVLGQQADRFAESLLMPADLFSKYHGKVDGCRYLLAGHFEVGVRPVERRGLDLGLRIK